MPRVRTTSGPGVCLPPNATTSSAPSWVLGSLPAVASSLTALPIHQCKSLSPLACHLSSPPSIFSHATASTSSFCTCHPEEHLHQTEANSQSEAEASAANFYLQLSLQKIHSVPGDPKPRCVPNETARPTSTKGNEGGNVNWRSRGLVQGRSPLGPWWRPQRTGQSHPQVTGISSLVFENMNDISQITVKSPLLMQS